MRKTRLLAFDFDGTLFDTNIANYHAYNRALSDLGYSMTPEFYAQYCNGKNYKEFLPIILKNNNESLLRDIHSRKKKYYREHYADVTPNADLFALIDASKAENTIAIVTTAARSSVLEILDFFSVRDRFDFVVAKEDVANLKPNPEGYIKAMRIAGATPYTTTIYEDSSVGLSAAYASGASVVEVNYSAIE